MVEHLNNESSIKLKSTGEKSYTATAGTIATSIPLLLTPQCTQITTIKNIQSMSDEQYISFNSKVKLFNDELSITTTTRTKFALIEKIPDVVACDYIQIAQEPTIVAVITSIGLVEQRCICAKCYSADVQCNDKTIKCITCKSRSLYLEQSVEQKQMKLNAMDTNQKVFEFIVKASQIQTLLQESNHHELCENDLIENENVLLALSSINIVINFNPKTRNINTIALNNINNN
ncbi:unnamed protein product [Rotaria socialis]|uniref:Uncharacterized protein n=1 Tax=Rotaria socialis TaxID=392032 RepID=A0A821GCA9_9BILA|nr:unnamed protein product [Rotaria socialis]